MILELGSGNMRKTDRLLSAVDRIGCQVTYYALDLDRAELQRSMDGMQSRYANVTVRAFWGTYDNARTKLPKGVRKSVWWLGSSIGNLERDEAQDFLRSYVTELDVGDTLICGIDRRNPYDIVQAAYHDSEEATTAFELNALNHANRVLGSKEFDLDKWAYGGEYDVVAGRHESWLEPTADVVVLDTPIAKGTHVRLERSYKYDVRETDKLWNAVGVRTLGKWADPLDLYDVHLVQKPPFVIAHSTEYAPVPILSEWEELWKAWDLVTLGMIPDALLHQKPIDLRHACIFYCGHIPTFLDIHLTRALQASPTPPAQYVKIFERGIDPNVDDPSQCHAHSEVPEEWPSLAEILAFRDRVRDRLLGLYADKSILQNNGELRRAVWLAYEHEAMHLETLLYMLVQSTQTRPPPGFPTPDFEALAQAVEQQPSDSDKWVTITPTVALKIGINDDEENVDDVRSFGWDNEKPARDLGVTAPFKVSKRPISCGEYIDYLAKSGQSEHIPKSWTKTSTGEHAVKTVYGPVPLSFCHDWPVAASYDELEQYAKYHDAEIPTAEQLRVVYDHIHAEDSRIPKQDHCVNSHLNDNGVHTTPPSGSPAKESSFAHAYYDLNGSNTSFNHWHPTPMSRRELVGIGGGGVWEWTSTVLEKHDGFVTSRVYPGYTADFFDTAHNVVLGASWATASRIAGRRSFVNWYQRKYGYASIGARIVQKM